MIPTLYRPPTIRTLKTLYLIINFLSVSAKSSETLLFNGNRSVEITVGVLLICFGIPLIFIGFKFFRTLMFLSGFLMFGLLAILISRVFISFDLASKNQLVSFYVGSVFASLAGGLISLYYVKIGVIIAGGCLGYFIGQAIVGARIVREFAGQIALIVFFVVLLAFLAFIFSSVILISATAGIGSFMFIGSVDLLSNSGIIKALVFYSRDTYSHQNQLKFWSIVASGFVLFLLGLLTQFTIKGYIKLPFFSKNSISLDKMDFPLKEQTKSESTTNLENHEAISFHEPLKSLLSVPEASFVNLRDIILEAPYSTDNSSPPSLNSTR